MSEETNAAEGSGESRRGDLNGAALEYHRFPQPGKISIQPTKDMTTQRDLALAYSPGVAAACLAIRDDPRIFGGGHLAPVETASTLRVADGSALVTDGPFAETKEVIAGYYLLEADDLDAALEIAGRVPAARMGGAVEVRPFAFPPH